MNFLLVLHSIKLYEDEKQNKHENKASSVKFHLLTPSGVLRGMNGKQASLPMLSRLPSVT